MNISYNWLKEYVDFSLSPMEISEVLTSVGLEVDDLSEVEAVPGGLKGLFVGKVLTCEAHPNSDHLRVTTVDLGKEEPQQIVCGAPNVAAGQKVIVADIGATLHDGDKSLTIKKSRLRGVDSYGMICAEDEIGVGSDHSGIIVLPDDAKVGTPAAEYYHLESDWLISIDITANRGDALSHYGVARDLYAWLKQNGHETELHRPGVDEFTVDNEDLPIDVEIENPEACMRFSCVSLTDCEVKESPEWLRKRLLAVGLRPINNIVDITNYVMMAYGQPLHCYDADMVVGNKIIVKSQPEGTKFVTLDGAEHILGPDDLSICNAEEPMSIAGILGGKGSGTYETTHRVVFESALFNPAMIRKSARKHGLSTDASYRFERGVDADGVVYALKQAAILCRELAGGKISMRIKDVFPKPKEEAKVSLRYDYVDNLIGKKIGKETLKNILNDLAVRIDEEKNDSLELTIPAFRVDVTRPCDVVEDVLRIYGYNNVEAPLQLKNSLTVLGEEDINDHLKNVISEQLVGEGFNEILNNSLTKVSYYDDLNKFTSETTVKIMNPLSSDLGAMRQTMLFGGLESISHNVNHKRTNLKFFEFGNCYSVNPDKKSNEDPVKAYGEETRLGLWLTGKRHEENWALKTEDETFFDLKAYVHNIFQRLGVPGGMLVVKNTDNNIFSQGLTILNHQGHVWVEMGLVDRQQLKKADLKNPVFFAEIHWSEIKKTASEAKVEYKVISRYPAVSRDLALLVDKKVKFEQIERIAQKSGGKLLKHVELFDVYEGEKLTADKKSYAVNFMLQDSEKTLTDKQIDSVMNKIMHNLASQLGAELR